jgi:hypothetical protein
MDKIPEKKIFCSGAQGPTKIQHHLQIPQKKTKLSASTVLANAFRHQCLGEIIPVQIK